MKKLLLFLILIMILPIVSAVQPQTFDGTSGLVVRIPQGENIIKGGYISPHFHVFDSVNGTPITNKSVNCMLHIYNGSGNHIYLNNNIREYEDYDFEAGKITGIFNKTGHYSLIIFCNSSLRGGFASEGFEVTEDGKSNTINDGSSGITVAIFIIIITMGLFGLSLSDKPFTENSEVANFILKKCCLIFAMFLLTLDTAIVASIADTGNLYVMDQLFTFMWIINWSIYLLMVYLFFNTIVKSLDLYKEKKHKKRMGNE